MAFLLVAFSEPTRAQITINGAQTNQVINGFGANINHRSWNNADLKPALNTLINQGGFTIFRVVLDNTDWEMTNNTTQAYYNSVYGSARFEKLWDIIAYLNQQGITNGVMFNFQGPGPAWMGGTALTPGDESQWAQMIVSLLSYARNTRHLQFNLVAPDNEPDGSSLNGFGCSDTQYVTMLHDLAADLNSNGLTDVQFVGPDLASTSTTWINQMMGDSLLMSKLAHFGLHSYSAGGGGSSGVASYLASSPYPNSTFWMTEFNAQCPQCINGVDNTNNYTWTYASETAQYLLSHLANGASAGLAWEGYDSYYQLLPLASLQSPNQASGWSFFGLLGVDNTNAVPKTYTPRKNFYAMAQIAAFVPPGSQRINVGGSVGSISPLLAFYHAASGRVTLTGVNTGSQTSFSVALQSLPAVASFALYYTDQNNNLNQSATFPVSGGSFSPTIPANCVFTLTGFDPTKIAVTVQVTNPASGTQFTAPATIPLAATASTTTGSITNVTFFNGATAIGTASSAPYDMVLSNIAPGTYVVSASAVNSAGNTRVSPGVTITVAGPAAQIVVVPANTTWIAPTSTTVYSYSRQQFAASVVDALGTTLQPQPELAWAASGGGTVDDEGCFSAGGSVGGPFAVVATNGGLSGLAAVNIASNVNLAPSGIGYIWYNLPNSVGNSSQYEMPAVNDGDVVDSFNLLNQYDGSADSTGAYEGAGVIWSIPQTISSVVFINGSASGGNGSFDGNFQLQFTRDGSTWAAADPSWTVTPAYSYNSSAASGVSYVFSGSLATVLGVRCVGLVNSGHGTSGYGSSTEVQAYLGAPPTLQATGGANGVVVWWSSSLTNCVLQATTNDLTPWTTLTNAMVYSNGQTSVTIKPTGLLQYFRLQFP